MVVIAGEARLVGFGRRDARSEVDRLYRRHSDEVLRYATLVLRSQPDAEDVVQATFMRALRAITMGERVQKPRNWLIKIAHNECRRALSVRSRRAEVELKEVPSEAAETGRADELRQALGQLAPKQREALVLRELEGRSYSEIAATLGISGSAVETLIFRARRAVREQLEPPLACNEAVELIAADVVADDERRRLRAHTRGCAECATLERQARGRKSALRRLASSLGLPWFGKVAVVALTVSTAATTTGVLLDRPAKGKPQPQVHQPAVSPAAVRPGAPSVWTQKGGAQPARNRPTATQPSRRPTVSAASTRRTPGPGPARTAPVLPAAGAAPPAAAPATVAGPEPSPTPTGSSSPVPPAGGLSVPAIPPVAATPSPPPLAAPVTAVLAPVAAVTEPVVAAVVTPVAAVIAPVAAVTEPATSAVKPVTEPVTQPVSGAVSTVTNAVPVQLPPPPPLPLGLLGNK